MCETEIRYEREALSTVSGVKGRERMKKSREDSRKKKRESWLRRKSRRENTRRMSEAGGLCDSGEERRD